MGLVEQRRVLLANERSCSYYACEEEQRRCRSCCACDSAKKNRPETLRGGTTTAPANVNGAAG
ncbi:hypothetical protein SESBI_00526 [Sesbania bispinosa]|nr:hypothetical protein SESBI_00526 [Sesbania bispinosa]